MSISEPFYTILCYNPIIDTISEQEIFEDETLFTADSISSGKYPAFIKLAFALSNGTPLSIVF